MRCCLVARGGGWQLSRIICTFYVHAHVAPPPLQVEEEEASLIIWRNERLLRSLSRPSIPPSACQHPRSHYDTLSRRRRRSKLASISLCLSPRPIILCIAREEREGAEEARVTNCPEEDSFVTFGGKERRGRASPIGRAMAPKNTCVFKFS